MTKISSRRVSATAYRMVSRKAAAATALARRFRADRAGVAAIEFAFLIPLLFCIYFGSMEIMQAIDTNRKLGRASAQIADLVSQNINTSKADIDAIMNIGAATLSPYDRSTPDIKITAVKMSDDASPVATILWKRTRVGGSFASEKASSTTVDIPSTFKVKGDVVIKVEMSMKYALMLDYNSSSNANYGVVGLIGGIPMSETYYFRPRVGGTVNCSDCGT